MHFDPQGKFIRTDIWREGQWIDLWSIVHFLSGAAIGFFPRYLGLDALPAFVIVFLLLVIYEMFEAIAKIEETRTNRIMDVVVGMVSFTPVFILNQYLSLSTSFLLCGLITTTSIILATVGWTASKKASVLEANLRKEFEEQKEKFQERKEKRKARRARARHLLGKTSRKGE